MSNLTVRSYNLEDLKSNTDRLKESVKVLGPQKCLFSITWPIFFESIGPIETLFNFEILSLEFALVTRVRIFVP